MPVFLFIMQMTILFVKMMCYEDNHYGPCY